MIKGTHHTNKSRAKLSASHMGKIQSDECKQKISESLRGTSPWNTGIKLTIEHKRKISESKKGQSLSCETIEKLRGENHYNWKGGISLGVYATSWTDALKELIRERDNYLCQICGASQNALAGWLKALDVHHIDYNKLNCKPINLVTLCRSCHVKTNYNRGYWEILLTQLSSRG